MKNRICDICSGKGVIAVDVNVSTDDPLWHPDGMICPKCDGLGLVDSLSDMKIISVKQEENNLMTVTFHGYDSDDWINCVKHMRDQDRVTIVEYLALERISRKENKND